jgi:dihydrofolate reductase
MIISMMVAMADDRAIGGSNGLLWQLKDDLKLFKRHTQGHTVIMGRKTFESIGRPLPNRRNIVISRTMQAMEGVEVFSDPDEALQSCTDAEENEVFIIGGGEIYRQFLPMADHLYISHVRHQFPEADTFFPEFKMEEWDRRGWEHYDADERNEFAFDFCVYCRSLEHGIKPI